MTDNQINNRVCKACGWEADSLGGLGTNEYCLECRQYQQELIRRKTEREENERRQRRMSHFGVLYG